jgi:hypothetical protein
MSEYNDFDKLNTKPQESRRHDDKGLLSLRAVSVLTFVFIVAMCEFGL